MANHNVGDVGRDMGAVPFGSLISNIAIGIGQGQWELDKSSIRVAELMSGSAIVRDLQTGEFIYSDDAKTKVQKVDTRINFGFDYIEDDQGKIERIPKMASMIELGFTPNFYQFVDTIIEIKIVVKMTQSDNSDKKENTQTAEATQQDYKYRGGSRWWSSRPYSQSYDSKRQTAKTQTVDANYTSKYNYSVEGSSMVRTKIVPVPPPGLLEDRVRQIVEMERVIAEQAIGADIRDKMREGETVEQARKRLAEEKAAGGGK